MISASRLLILAAFSLLAVSCLSTSAGMYRESELAGARSKFSWITPLQAGLKDAGRFHQLLASPRETFKLYCINGRPAKSWSMPVKAVVPRPPAGIPIDQAAELRGKVYQAFKAIVGASIFQDEQAPMVKGQEETKPLGTLVALDSPQRADIEKSFRHTRLSDSVTTMLLAFGEEKGLVLGALQAKQYSIQRGAGVVEDKWQLNESSESNRGGQGIMGVVWPERGFKNSRGEIVWPIHPAGILEASLLPSQFTLLIPHAVQRRFFGDQVPGRGFFIRDDGAFDLSEAISKRQQVWNAYFSKAIAVDEAQTSDPDVVQFNMRLDLELFCAYARPVDELLTK
ncbi:MAG: hypothetical protein RIQ81_346 [Pseudomonadota bacterium]|jgi:hypothetical protein